MKFPFTPEGSGTIKRGFDFLKNNGLGNVISNVKYKMSGSNTAYNNWYKSVHEADEEELAVQKKHSFAYEPFISIIVPVYMTPEFYLRSMIESVQAQTYEKWQLCIVDVSQADMDDGVDEMRFTAYERTYSMETEKIVAQYANLDNRISYKLLEHDMGTSENANVAIRMAVGDYVTVIGQNDLIAEDALYHVAGAINEKRYDVVYSDEDRVSTDGTKHQDPIFKPDFSIDLLRSLNYMQHLFVVKRVIAMECGGFRTGYEGAWLYDFILRCCERAKSIKHIPRVLYHWRVDGKTTEDADRREVINETGRKAVSSHIKRCQYYATVAKTEIEGMYKVSYETPGNPLVSIVIPGEASPELMEKCLKPLYEFSRYSNFELIIIDCYGDNQEMIKFYQRIQRKRRNIRVIAKTEFKTLGEVRNYGAGLANGDYILFLDGCTQLIEPTSIRAMLGFCMRDDVGIAGATLYNDNSTINSAGFIIGMNGVADSIHAGTKKGEPGYLMYNRANNNCSAVSASCMMVKKNIFKQLKGFSTEYLSNLADIDFCLRCRDSNYLIVSVGDASWYIHPAGKDLVAFLADMPADKLERKLRSEKNIFRNLWSEIIENGDPYYNVNYVREGNPFSLKKE
ncbi:MAG: glycosyltransferase [Lachnospiraceae bacterium]|nr:glycosyltransferase [Lachnospiraceae bacterium]